MKNNKKDIAALDKVIEHIKDTCKGTFPWRHFHFIYYFIARLGTYKYPYLTGSFPSCSLLDFLSGKPRSVLDIV